MLCRPLRDSRHFCCYPGTSVPGFHISPGSGLVLCHTSNLGAEVHFDSVAPSGLSVILILPRAYALGCILAALRGW